MELVSKSPKETYDLGKKIGNNLAKEKRKKARVLALSGELGSGKTTFVQGLSEGLGIEDRIISPTFILMRKYVRGAVNFYHLDLYRLEGDVEAQVRDLGVPELWDEASNIVVIEWAEKVEDIVPKNATWITFKSTNDSRIINIEGLR